MTTSLGTSPEHETSVSCIRDLTRCSSRTSTMKFLKTRCIMCSRCGIRAARCTKFAALTKKNNPIRPHPNTFVLSRARFLRYYGYDEDFCGHYGFDDSIFRRWQRNHGTRFRYLPACCHTRRRPMSKIGGHSLVRDLTHNRELAKKKKEIWKEYGPEAGHSRRFLNFSWRIVEDRRRANAPLPERKHRLWTKTWWWRWLRGG